MLDAFLIVAVVPVEVVGQKSEAIGVDDASGLSCAVENQPVKLVSPGVQRFRIVREIMYSRVFEAFADGIEGGVGRRGIDVVVSVELCPENVVCAHHDGHVRDLIRIA